MATPRIIAHRGFSARHPENTRPAFVAAREAGADGIETDLQLTADGRVLLYHDDEATTLGHPGVAVADRDAAFWSTTRLGGEPLMFLEDLLPMIQGSFTLMAELKSDLAAGDDNRRRLVRRTLETLKAGGALEATELLCFDPRVLEIAHDLEPSVPTVLNIERWPTDDDLTSGGALAALSSEVGILDDDLAVFARDRGLRLITWTVNTPDQLERALSFDVDAVLGDDPAWLRSACP